ncbi:MAG: DUF362 domain-containing protein [Isosphaeraceae bacterium]
MRKRRPCGGQHRRQFLADAAAIAAATTAWGALGTTYTSAQEPKAALNAAGRGPVEKAGPLGVPGPYPGRVIEARNQGMVRDGKRDRAAIRSTLDRALTELTGADDATEAWRTFVQPDDAVGIKVVPNGHPAAPTSPELILEVIDSLVRAGVKLREIVVFDRYQGEFLQAGYQKILPEGVTFGGLSPASVRGQLDQTFEESKSDPVVGYDPDEFVELPLVSANSDMKDDRIYRSHLGKLVTKRLSKVICLPCLKDHGSAGVTGALKNMSHGFVNNVERSHSTPWTNACNLFIPSVVKHPIIRSKCVLQIMDGTRGVWQGGPFGNNPKWAWDYNALLVATDPVALDHVEWDIIDAKRQEMNVPGVAQVGRLLADPFQREGFDARQPQHIGLAANLGLGYYDFKSPRGRKFSIQHQVIEMKVA